MKKANKVVGMILLCMLTAINVGCSNTNEQSEIEDSLTNDAVIDTSGDNSESLAEELESEKVDETEYSLPSKNFEGYDFKIQMRSGYWTPQDVYVESTNGEALNDAVYARNAEISRKYNVNIIADVTTLGSNDYREDVKTTVLAGDAGYDCYMMCLYDAAKNSINGVWLDINTVDYIDFDKEWWNGEQIRSLSIDNKLYYAASLGVNAYNATRMVYFNKNIIADRQLENVYQTVKDGKWTYDKLHEMSSKAYEDLNGDGVMDNTDQFGLVGQYLVGRSLYFASGEHMILKDENDIPYIAVGNERSVDVFTKISDMLSDSNSFYHGPDEDCINMFKEGRALFLSEVLEKTLQFREIEVDYGIIPSPKYNEDQENYVQYADGNCTTGICIPYNTEDPDRTGFVLEAIAYESMDTVLPAFYTKCLTGRNLRDAESEEMLSIICDTWTLDLGNIYKWGGLNDGITDALKDGGQLMSTLESLRSATESEIAAAVEAYKK